MIKHFAIGLNSLLLTLFLLTGAITAAEAFEARVIGIMDGDTIEVLKDRKPVRIRLYGVDSPEHDQDFGSKARRFTSEKVFRKTVEIVPIETDKYGRIVGKVYIDGSYLNRMIVQEGYAWWYKSFASKEHDLEQAELEARKARRGLWAHPNPVPPWKFRRHHKPISGNGF